MSTSNRRAPSGTSSTPRRVTVGADASSASSGTAREVARPGTIGGTLRAARVAKGLSLQQVADVTRIAPRVLEALEADDVSRLPGGIFSRSFVRSYANHLGLNPDASVKQFLQQFPDDAPPEEQALAAWQAHEAALSRPAGQSIRIVIGAVVAIAALAAAGWYWWQARDPQAPPASVAAEEAAPSSVPRAAGVGDTEEAPTPASPQSNGAEPGASAVPQVAGASQAPAPAPGGDPNGAPPPDPALVGPPPAVAAPPPAALPESLEVVIEPVATCWVRLMVDGEFAFARVLRPGEREVRTAVDQVVFDIGDASAFRFSINGVPGRVLGRKGQVVTARISRENVASYLAQ